MSSSDTNPAIRVSDRTIVSLPAKLLIALVIVTFGGATVWATTRAQLTATQMQLATTQAKVEAHDSALHRLEVMANDIAWIKAEMARQRHDRREP